MSCRADDEFATLDGDLPGVLIAPHLGRLDRDRRELLELGELEDVLAFEAQAGVFLRVVVALPDRNARLQGDFVFYDDGDAGTVLALKRLGAVGDDDADDVDAIREAGGLRGTHSVLLIHGMS